MTKDEVINEAIILFQLSFPTAEHPRNRMIHPQDPRSEVKKFRLMDIQQSI